MLFVNYEHEYKIFFDYLISGGNICSLRHFLLLATDMGVSPSHMCIPRRDGGFLDDEIPVA